LHLWGNKSDDTEAKKKARGVFMSESAMERTTIMVTPPIKSIPVRCKTCGKLMKIKKKNMDQKKTNVIESECHECRTKALKKKKEKAQKKGFLLRKKTEQDDNSSEMLVQVKCSRCKTKFEVTAQQRAKNKSYLCVTCRSMSSRKGN
jgi:hypothetical protein